MRTGWRSLCCQVVRSQCSTTNTERGWSIITPPLIDCQRRSRCCSIPSINQRHFPRIVGRHRAIERDTPPNDLDPCSGRYSYLQNCLHSRRNERNLDRSNSPSTRDRDVVGAHSNPRSRYDSIVITISKVAPWALPVLVAAQNLPEPPVAVPSI